MSFGVLAADLVWAAAAALGVTALLVASEPAFLALRLVGAGYLIFLGVRLLFAQTRPGVDSRAVLVGEAHSRYLVSMRTRWSGLIAGLLVLGVLAPAASAKGYWFRMREHVFVVGKTVKLELDACPASGCLWGYKGAVKLYLVPASTPVGPHGSEPATRPASAQVVGRARADGRLLLTPRAPGRYRLVLLATLRTDGRTALWQASPGFAVHPRGWQRPA